MIRTIPSFFVNGTSRLGAEQLLGGQQLAVLLTFLSWHEMAVSEARRAMMRAAVFSTCHIQSRPSISQRGLRVRRNSIPLYHTFLSFALATESLGQDEKCWNLLLSRWKPSIGFWGWDPSFLEFSNPEWSLCHVDLEGEREGKLLVQITDSHLSNWIFIDM